MNYKPFFNEVKKNKIKFMLNTFIAGKKLKLLNSNQRSFASQKK